MSKQGRAGKQQWRARQGAYRQELTEQITARADRRWQAWTRAGRVPVWVRVKARLRGQRPISSPGDHASGS